MKRRRIFWILWLILSVIYLILSDYWLARTLLILSVVLTVYAWISVRVIGRYVHFSIVTEGEVLKQAVTAGELRVKNTGIFPLAQAQVCFAFHNIRNGETENMELLVAAAGRKTESFPFEMRCRHSGQMKIELSGVQVSDYLGLFQKTIRPDCSSEIYILPETFQVDVDITSRSVQNRNSDYYADDRKGYDSGETFGIREYVPGDNTKFIHWKLSSKLDKVLIRELGFPIQNSILIFLETGWHLAQPDADSVDAMTEAAVSVVSALVEQGMEPHFCFYDHAQARLEDYEVTDRDALASATRKLLETSTVEDPCSTITYYMELWQECQAAHVVYISTEYLTDEIRPLLNGSCVTVLQCRSDLGEGVDEIQDGMTIIPFYGDSLREDLEELNI